MRAGKLDCLHPARLIEHIAIGLGNRSKDSRSALALGTTHQGLITPDLAPRHIYDGVEGNGKRLCILAALARNGVHCLNLY